MKAKTAVLGSITVILLSACASIPAPTEQMAVSKVALNNAVSAGAGESAQLELRNAQEKLDRANAAMSAEEFERARRWAEQAEVDAKLAEAKARSTKAYKAVEEVQASLRALREEINRQTK